jgi:hypothetical protein
MRLLRLHLDHLSLPINPIVLRHQHLPIAAHARRRNVDPLNQHLLVLGDIDVRRLLSAPGAQRGIEALAQGLDHLGEPEPVEAVEHEVASQVRKGDPQGHFVAVGEAQHGGVFGGAGVGGGHVVVGFDGGVQEGDRPGFVGGPDVAEDLDGLVGAPEEAAGHEGQEQEDAVDELQGGAGEGELVAEPVDVEEGGGELVEDEGWGVEVHEGALECVSSFIVIQSLSV